MCSASSGTEGAAFLNIPVGAGPAAMGGAYSALAADAYAATYNPAGLGFLNSTQFSGQHLSYLDSIHYEYLSFAVPLGRRSSDGSGTASSLGGSVQYLGSGDVAGMDRDGNPTGTISSNYASYNLSYGRHIGDKLSLGLTGKMINAELADVSANAYAADLGAMYRPQTNLHIAATVTNLGSTLKFLSAEDSLPLAFHLGAAYQPASRWLFSAEGVYAKTHLASFHAGGEWRPLDLIAIRAGYRTDTLKGLSPIAGVSAGLGLNLWGQEIAYAYLPFGDLGSTHYASLLMKFGEAESEKHNLIQYHRIKLHRTANNALEESGPDDLLLMQLLDDGAPS